MSDLLQYAPGTAVTGIHSLLTNKDRTFYLVDNKGRSSVMPYLRPRPSPMPHYLLEYDRQSLQFGLFRFIVINSSMARNSQQILSNRHTDICLRLGSLLVQASTRKWPCKLCTWRTRQTQQFRNPSQLISSYYLGIKFSSTATYQLNHS